MSLDPFKTGALIYKLSLVNSWTNYMKNRMLSRVTEALITWKIECFQELQKHTFSYSRRIGYLQLLSSVCWYYTIWRNSFNFCSWLLVSKGLLERQALQEADEDIVTDVDFTNTLSEEEREELKAELAKVICLGFLDF